MDRTVPDWRTIDASTDAFEQPPPRARPDPTLLAVLAVLATAAVAVVATGWLLLGTTPSPEIALEGAPTGPPGPATGAASSAAPSAGADAPLVGAAVPSPVAIVVDVEGAVARPGIYRLPAGRRVGDAIAAAGGYALTVDALAASLTLNLAERLSDGMKVRVPARGESTAPAQPGATSTVPAGGGPALVDLNRASQEELESLPGVGPVTATEIIAAREQAPFTAIEELRSRGIVGEKTFDKLRALVTVGQ